MSVAPANLCREAISVQARSRLTCEEIADCFWPRAQRGKGRMKKSVVLFTGVFSTISGASRIGVLGRQLQIGEEYLQIFHVSFFFSLWKRSFPHTSTSFSRSRSRPYFSLTISSRCCERQDHRRFSSRSRYGAHPHKLACSFSCVASESLFVFLSKAVIVTKQIPCLTNGMDDALSILATG